MTGYTFTFEIDRKTVVHTFYANTMLEANRDFTILFGNALIQNVTTAATRSIFGE